MDIGGARQLRDASPDEDEKVAYLMNSAHRAHIPGCEVKEACRRAVAAFETTSWAGVGCGNVIQ